MKPALAQLPRASRLWHASHAGRVNGPGQQGPDAWPARWRTSVLFASLIATVSGALAQSVALTGVSGSRALVVVDGSAPKFLSEGQTHQGVKLLGVKGDTATVELDGARHTLRVGEAPVSVGRGAPGDAGGQRVVLTADGRGHFISGGLINGRPVQFLVDTGATTIILGEEDARRINLPVEQGSKVGVRTANGAVTGHSLRLQSVKLGDVQVHDVAAIVLPQAMPYVLLGNSFLTRFQMQRQNDQLTLERRY